jgi:hypothetical protein
MVRGMKEKVREPVMRIETGPEITIPPAFATGTGEVPAEGHFGSSDDGQ